MPTKSCVYHCRSSIVQMQIFQQSTVDITGFSDYLQITMQVTWNKKTKDIKYYNKTFGKVFCRITDHPPQIFFLALWIHSFVCCCRVVFKTQVLLGTSFWWKCVQRILRSVLKCLHLQSSCESFVWLNILGFKKMKKKLKYRQKGILHIPQQRTRVDL